MRERAPPSPPVPIGPPAGPNLNYDRGEVPPGGLIRHDSHLVDILHGVIAVRRGVSPRAAAQAPCDFRGRQRSLSPSTFEPMSVRGQQIIEVSGHTGEPKCMKTLRVSPRDLTSSMVSRTTCPSSGMPS